MEIFCLSKDKFKLEVIKMPKEKKQNEHLLHALKNGWKPYMTSQKTKCYLIFSVANPLCSDHDCSNLIALSLLPINYQSLPNGDNNSLSFTHVRMTVSEVLH